MQWVTQGPVDVNIGANPSAEEAEEGVEDTAKKVVDIVDTFRLQVSFFVAFFLFFSRLVHL
jgi:hypothetical protein